MAYLDYGNRIKRVDFSKNEKVQEIPNLIEVQQESYEDFLQAHIPPEKRREIGLQAVFRGIFPITDYNGRASLEFLSYAIGEPKWSEEEWGSTPRTWRRARARSSSADAMSASALD